jgi:type II secretory pathway pseudopilin PulG
MFQFMQIARRAANSQKGFSILEVMAAVYIISMGLVGILSLMSFSYNVKYENKNNIIASMLAQEGLELIRNTRDSNFLTEGTEYDDGISSGGVRIFIIDFYGKDYIKEVVGIDDAATRLYLDSNGFYAHTVGSLTPYSRIITVTDQGNYLDVLCLVRYSKGGNNHDYIASTQLYDWMGGGSPSCSPDCAGKECGDDGCGGTCGSCDTGFTCNTGVCVAESYQSPASFVFFRVNSFYANDFDADAADDAINHNGQSCYWKVYFSDPNGGAANYDVRTNTSLLMSVNGATDCSGGYCRKYVNKCTSYPSFYDNQVKIAYVVAAGSTDISGAPSASFTNSCSAGAGVAAQDGWDNDCNVMLDECGVCNAYRRTYDRILYQSETGGISCTGNTLSVDGGELDAFWDGTTYCTYSSLANCIIGNSITPSCGTSIGIQPCSHIMLYQCSLVPGADPNYLCDNKINVNGACEQINGTMCPGGSCGIYN